MGQRLTRVTRLAGTTWSTQECKYLLFAAAQRSAALLLINIYIYTHPHASSTTVPTQRKTKQFRFPIRHSVSYVRAHSVWSFFTVLSIGYYDGQFAKLFTHAHGRAIVVYNHIISIHVSAHNCRLY